MLWAHMQDKPSANYNSRAVITISEPLTNLFNVICEHKTVTKNPELSKPRMLLFKERMLVILQ